MKPMLEENQSEKERNIKARKEIYISWKNFP
jgi:hypothetical protein